MPGVKKYSPPPRESYGMGKGGCDVFARVSGIDIGQVKIEWHFIYVLVLF